MDELLLSQPGVGLYTVGLMDNCKMHNWRERAAGYASCDIYMSLSGQTYMPWLSLRTTTNSIYTKNM